MKKMFFVLFLIYLSVQYVNAQMSQEYFIKNLNVNQAYSDIGVSFFNEDFIVFSAQERKPVVEHSRKRRRRKSKNIKLSPQNLEFNFCALGENGNFINSQKLSSQINSEHDEIGLAFSKDQSTVFFAREMWIKNSKKKHFELFTAQVVSPGSWNMIRKLKFNDPSHSLISPCLSDDDKTLYYASNIDGNYSIYKVKILSNGDFGEPTKLPNSINTSNDEITPFVKHNKLYFSSNKSGVFDVYSADINANVAPVKLDTPINSDYNDTYFIINNSKKGFFTSDRPGGKGKEDVYYFEKIIDEPVIEEENNIVITNDVLKSDNDVVVTNKQIVSNNVIAVVENNRTTKISSESLVENKTAYDYQRRSQYDNKKEVITVFNDDGTTSGANLDDEYSKCQIMFDNLDNIYFDYSESSIGVDAATELNKVIHVMLMCPKINVVASSHTDCRASYDYNLNLSQERSSSVVDYILKNGKFDSSRIVGIGYGESRLINRCADDVKCSEKEHQMNRRTHFEISNY